MEIRNIHGGDKSFRVTHKQLEVSTEDYFNSLNNFHDPFSQAALQQFVVNYLEEDHDDGLIGLVRYKEDGDNVVIDAAVRYME
ncbi:hypothetical protein HYG86_02870 [Alkalicella caledoniensis]|uniref:Uncharacterized protein n=1 Tax=Alkalicella caledoniensis TaxID=2731377 RepID=A0A7G9W514_ALKCA|nr:hypothetical protein [Alkalicella caledoniensis]QNO13776.1 hypothetical protein HYG86_02870 [Alkalicella caledoniensis]